MQKITDVKGDSGEISEKRRAEEKTSVIGNNHERNVSRNMDSKDHSAAVLDGNEELIIGNWRKGHSFYSGKEQG